MKTPEVRIKMFSENPVSFLLSKENGVMVNATEMAKIFGKQTNEFMSNQTTIAFVKECLKSGNSRFINISKESDLYRSVQKSGTYMHRVLALKFAAWLSPQFELWVYSTIEDLLFGKYVEREKSLERTIALQSEINDLEYKAEKTGDDFERYLYLKKELNREKSLRSFLTRETLEDIQTLFVAEEGGEV